MPGAVVIVPYRGFGDAHRFTLTGRVLAYRRAPAIDKAVTLWHNLMATYRRFETDEAPNARVRATYGPIDIETVTDEEGYFHFDLQPDRLVVPEAAWQSIDLTHPTPPGAAYAPAHAVGQVLVPPPTARFGVISDIDDTILQSGAARPLTVLRNVLLRSAQQRLPFAGVAAFYQALQRGPSGHAGNPLFYVSSSPWNLYDFLEDFIELNDIPAGPLLLRDIGIDADKFIASSHQAHKAAQIARILETYPGLAFVLIGDSGQRDPEIYEQVAHDFPDRVLAIYIRQVASPARGAQVGALARRLQTEGVDLLLVNDSAEAARHAAHSGLIAQGALAIVEALCPPSG